VESPEGEQEAGRQGENEQDREDRQCEGGERQEPGGGVLAEREDRVPEARGRRRGGRAYGGARGVDRAGRERACDHGGQRRNVRLQAGLAREEDGAGRRVDDGPREVEDVVDHGDLVADEVCDEEGGEDGEADVRREIAEGLCQLDDAEPVEQRA
jgi:hypothetical protein